MSSNVVDLPVITTLKSDPRRVLQGALEEDFDRVLVIGSLMKIADED